MSKFSNLLSINLSRCSHGTFSCCLQQMVLVAASPPPVHPFLVKAFQRLAVFHQIRLTSLPPLPPKCVASTSRERRYFQEQQVSILYFCENVSDGSNRCRTILQFFQQSPSQLFRRASILPILGLLKNHYIGLTLCRGFVNVPSDHTYLVFQVLSSFIFVSVLLWVVLSSFCCSCFSLLSIFFKSVFCLLHLPIPWLEGS